MSGAAWLPANLFGLAALLAQQRRRPVLMVGAALAASFSYGTGLAVWPALLVAGALRDRKVLSQWYVAVIGLLVGIWYRHEFLQINRDTVGSPTPRRALRNVLELIGAYLYPQDSGVSIPVGAAILGAAVGLAGAFAWIRLRRAGEDHGGSAWTGLLTFALGAAGLNGAARDNYFVSHTASRYAAIGALVLVALLGLAASVLPRWSWAGRAPRWLSAVLVAPLLLAVTLAGATREPEMEATRRNQEILTVAMHIGAASDSTHWMGGLGRLPIGIEDLLRANDHIPFDGSFDLDCGRLGTHLEPAELGALPPGVDALVEAVEPETRMDALGATGWIDAPAMDVECIVIADQEATVIGAAGFGDPSEGFGPRDDPRRGLVWFYGLARRAEESWVYVRFEGDDVFRVLPLAP
jgi:hypothetical protein